jgi:hypothetical protein
MPGWHRSKQSGIQHYEVDANELDGLQQVHETGIAGEEQIRPGIFGRVE